MDRLIAAIEQTQNPSVVGLDPTPALVPTIIVDEMREEVEQEVDAEQEHELAAYAIAYLEFNRAIIDAIADIVPAVKPQIAMYEALGAAGLDAYTMTCEYAQSKGLYVLGDIKRGDIGSTAAAYAAHLAGFGAHSGHVDMWHEDAITINPYLGSDGVEPFINAANAHDGDVFALVRTSNPSSAQIQEVELASGMHLYEHIADLVSQWGNSCIGEYGYSRLGAVVGATHPEQGQALRARMPHTFFLVPGYGAQGGTAADVMGMFDSQGRGALVNSSRGIIGAWKKQEPTSYMSAQDALDHVAVCARKAACAMRDDLQSTLAER